MPGRYPLRIDLPALAYAYRSHDRALRELRASTRTRMDSLPMEQALSLMNESQRRRLKKLLDMREYARRRNHAEAQRFAAIVRESRKQQPTRKPVPKLIPVTRVNSMEEYRMAFNC